MSAPRVTFFTRQGCHLCEVALEQVQTIAAQVPGAEIEVVDIESSDELLVAHLERIPVVEVDGAEVSILELDRKAFGDAIGLTSGPSGQVA